MLEWEHRCENMPEELVDGICKFDWSDTHHFTVNHYIKGVASMNCTFYGLKYCPYCGKKIGELNEETTA